MDDVFFRGAAKRLDDEDLPRIGAGIGVGEDEIHAVLDVEASGSGFDADGRLKMLFEYHIFWEELGDTAKRRRAKAAGLACPKWGQIPYPRGGSYPHLLQAMGIDRTAALRSASWGLGQIMGRNHKLAGYGSVDAMILAFRDDEEAQLKGMVSFIVNSGLDDELRRHDWAGFALGYNGKGYRRNAYDVRLKRAFAHWQQIRDTPWPRPAAKT